MKTIKIGSIGCGGRGTLVKNAHQPENGFIISAVSDLDENAFKEYKELCGDNIFTTNNYKDILKIDDIDVVFITTPDYLHEEMAINALKAGKAVYLEKPMAITIEGCDRILQTAFETGSKLYLGHNMRHFASVLKMKEIIDSGIIGDIQTVWCRHFINYGGDAYFKDWHSEQRYSNGLLLQKGAHDIDVMHWLAGGFTTKVSGMGKLSVYDKCSRRPTEQKGIVEWNDDNWPPLEQKDFSPEINVEDSSMIMMQLDNGVQMSYNQCHYAPDCTRNYTFIGTKGRIENIGDTGKCQVWVYTSRKSAFHDPDIKHQLFPVEGTHGGADPLIVNEFLNFVAKNIKTSTNPIAARYAVATGVKATESIRTGGGLLEIPKLSDEIINYFENGQQK